MNFYKTERQRLPGMNFCRVETLPQKFITSVPVLFPPFPFFLLLSSQKCKEAFFFLFETNSIQIHSPHYHLKTRILLPGQTLHPLSKFSAHLKLTWMQLDLITFWTYPFSYCISIVCIYHKAEIGTWDKKTFIFMFKSCHSGQCPRPNICSVTFELKYIITPTQK